MTVEIDTVLQEREFYFNKLRQIEILLQNVQDEIPDRKEDPIIKDVFAILYSTEVKYF